MQTYGALGNFFKYLNILHPFYRGKAILLHRKDITDQLIAKHENVVEFENIEPTHQNILDENIFLDEEDCDTPEKYELFKNQTEASTPSAVDSLSLVEQSNFAKEVARWTANADPCDGELLTADMDFLQW